MPHRNFTRSQSFASRLEICRTISIMRPEDLAQKIIQSLRYLNLLSITVDEPVIVIGGDRESLTEELKIKHNEIHRAGVYIFGTDDDILRIGEGGKGARGGGNMGHRAFIHININKPGWTLQATKAVFISITPAEFSRLGEQIAFSLYYEKEGKLPPHNKDWR